MSIDLESVFQGAKVFNGDVSKWDVAIVTNMGSMFIGATVFSRTWCQSDWVATISPADFDGSSDGSAFCCPTGKYYMAGTTCEGTCAAGKYNSDNNVKDQLPTACQSCARNTYSPIDGLPGCSDCKSDTYSAPGADECLKCPSGYKMLNREVAATATTCSICDAGKFQDIP